MEVNNEGFRAQPFSLVIIFHCIGITGVAPRFARQEAKLPDGGGGSKPKTPMS